MGVLSYHTIAHKPTTVMQIGCTKTSVNM